jgi:hypothetical protein
MLVLKASATQTRVIAIPTANHCDPLIPFTIPAAITDTVAMLCNTAFGSPAIARIPLNAYFMLLHRDVSPKFLSFIINVLKVLCVAK